MEKQQRIGENTGVGVALTTPTHIDADGGRDDMTTPTAKRTTAPAFQFYPKDFLSSSKVIRMTATERGIYITLLCVCWLEGGLPDDVSQLARLANVPLKQFSRIWPHNLQQCFTLVRGGKLVNERLDRERQKQAEFRRRASDSGRRSAEVRKGRFNQPSTGAVERTLNSPISDLQSPISDLQSPISDLQSKNVKNVSAEPPSDSTPTVLTFSVVGKPPSWELTQGRVDGWSTAYPNVDVIAECRRALAWLDAQPERRKTASGMPRFLVNWLNRTVERGGGRGLTLAATGTDGRGRTGAPPRGKYDGIEEE